MTAELYGKEVSAVVSTPSTAHPGAGSPAAHAPEPHTDGTGQGRPGRPHQGIQSDLVREGREMLELQMRQLGCLTPLQLSSKATQALLRHF